jgi:hypothetical protein
MQPPAELQNSVIPIQEKGAPTKKPLDFQATISLNLSAH